MGASPMQIIYKVLLPESLHSIVLGITLAVIALIGYSAMAGVLGGGGLGDLAIRYGYQMGYRDMIWLTVLIILAVISVFQFFGNLIIRRTTH